MAKTLQNSINFAEPLIQYSPLTVGKGQEPAVSTASVIRQTLLNPPNTWYFNRVETTFPLVKGTQDYVVPLPDFGFIEKVSLGDDQGNKWTVKDVYNNAALAPATEQARPNSIAIEGFGSQTTAGIAHSLVTVDITSNVATIVFDSTTGWNNGDSITMTVTVGPTFLNGQVLTITNIVGNTVTANYTHANWPASAGFATPATLVATLPVNCGFANLAYDPVTQKAVCFDNNTGDMNRIDLSGGVPVVDSTYTIPGILLGSYLLNALSMGYIGGVIYIGFYDHVTGTPYIHGLSDTSFTVVSSFAIDTPGAGSGMIPNTMRVWTHGGTNYLGFTVGIGTSFVYSTFRVFELTGNTEVFNDVFGAGIPLNFRISGFGPYFFEDPATGNTYIIFAYNASFDIYNGSGTQHNPTNWTILQYTPTGTKTTWTFSPDVDGNCGVGGFIDATTGKIVVYCNRGAIKLFDPGLGVVTLTYGSAASPTYEPSEEYGPAGSGPNTSTPDANGLYFAGTQGWPEAMLGNCNGTFFGSNATYQPLTYILDTRDSTTLAVTSTIDLSTLFATPGFNQFPSIMWYPAKNWLFWTKADDSSHVYVVGFTGTGGSDSATGTATTPSVTVSGPVFRFLAVPDQSYTAYMSYQKKPQPFGPYVVTGCGTASAGNTAYSGTFDTLSFPVGSQATISGFVTHVANNGTFAVVSCSSSQLVVANASGVSETITAYAANFDWAPLPDWFVDIYNNLFLAEMLSLVDEARSQQYRHRGIAAFLAKAEGLTEMQKNAFVEQWTARIRESASKQFGTKMADGFRGV